MGFSATYLNMLHTLVFLTGGVITGFSIYAIIEGDNLVLDAANEVVDFVPMWVWTWIPLVFGVLLMLISMFLCCCTKEGNFCFLSLYSIFLFLVGTIMIVAGSFIVIFAGSWAEEIASSTTASQGLDGLREEYSDFLLGLGTGCCQFTIDECPQSGYCYISENIYEAGISAVGNDVTDGYCAIKEIKNSCADGVQSFLEANQEILKTYMWPTGIAFIVLGSLLFIGCFLACHLGCKSKRTKQTEYVYKETSAGQVAYGGKSVSLA